MFLPSTNRSDRRASDSDRKATEPCDNPVSDIQPEAEKRAKSLFTLAFNGLLMEGDARSTGSLLGPW